VIGVVLGRLNPRLFVGPLALLSVAVTGATLLAAYLVAGEFLLSLSAWFLVGVVTTARTTALWNYVQGAFAPEILARVAGNTYLFTGVSSTAGAFVIGALSLSWSPAALTVLTGLGFVGSAVVGFVLSETRTLAF
jgi:hypothetical protein